MSTRSSRPTDDEPQSRTAAGLEYSDINKVAETLRKLRRSDVERHMWPLVWGPDKPLVTIGQFDTLDLIVSRPQWHMAEIAEALEVSPSTATRSIDPLVAERLATRRVSANDKRLTLVSATCRGRRLCRRLAEHRLDIMSEALSDFSAVEATSLVDLVSRLLGNLDHIVQRRTNPASAR